MNNLSDDFVKYTKNCRANREKEKKIDVKQKEFSND